MWDLGGQTSIRPYWRCYYPNTDAIIFVVDSCDSERLGIAKQELMAMLEVRSIRGRHRPFLVKRKFSRPSLAARPVALMALFGWRKTFESAGGRIEGCYFTCVCQQAGLQGRTQRPTSTCRTAIFFCFSFTDANPSVF